MTLGFTLLASDPSGARAGRLEFAPLHDGGPVRIVPTPAFMPVGTQATVKTLTPEEVRATGTAMILANTYHLYLRPGHERIRRLGGLHSFMAWNGPILTDSGGYQVHSLAKLNRIREDGVEFQSHIDGSRHRFTPALVTEIQLTLGADVIMAFDTMTPYPSTWARAREDVQRTGRWARECAEVWRDAESAGRAPGSSLFGIVQGGIYPDLRLESAEQLRALGLPGYAIGGLAVGEPAGAGLAALEATVPHLPVEKPRYLMGVGRPEDILEAVERGCDLFDCVLPTRNARKGTVFTSKGRLVVKNAAYAEDERPLDPGCDCPVCRTFTRAYVRHLFAAGEILGLRLATLHSLRYYQNFMEGIRSSIAEGRFAAFKRESLERLGRGTDDDGD